MELIFLGPGSAYLMSSTMHANCRLNCRVISHRQLERPKSNNFIVDTVESIFDLKTVQTATPILCHGQPPLSPIFHVIVEVFPVYHERPRTFREVSDTLYGIMITHPDYSDKRAPEEKEREEQADVRFYTSSNYVLTTIQWKRFSWRIVSTFDFWDSGYH